MASNQSLLRVRTSRIAAAAMAYICAQASLAQGPCTPQWIDGHTLPGLNGTGRVATMWDPDGPGPLPERLVVAGIFTVAGDVAANRVAVWDGSSWSALGGGFLNGEVQTLLALQNGDLVAGGTFTSSDTGTVNRVARWDGTQWSSIGTGMNGSVSAIVQLPNGDIVAAGSFSSAGGVAASRIARWDGVGWNPMGLGVNDTVYSLQAMPDGSVIVGGIFAAAGGVSARWVARWDSLTGAWTPMSAGLPAGGGFISALTMRPNGELFCGGFMQNSSNIVFRWSGAQWETIGTGTATDWVVDLEVMPGGDLIASGLFDRMNGTNASRIARWNGQSWFPLGSGLTGFPRVAVSTEGHVFATGSFLSVGLVPAMRVAEWDGLTWSALNPGTNGQVSAIARLPNGDLVVGGGFSTIEGVSAWRVARRDLSGSWSPCLPNLQGVGVRSIAVLPNGDFVVAGSFGVWVDEVHIQNIGRWDAAAGTWRPIGSGSISEVNAVVFVPDRGVVAARHFAAGTAAAHAVCVWDGESWTPIGSGVSSTVMALCAMPNGDVIAGGLFGDIGGVQARRIARWDGSVWHPLGSGVDSGSMINAIQLLPDNRVIVGGSFTSIGGVTARNVAIWDGMSWSAIGNGVSGPVNAISVSENIEITVGGGFNESDITGIYRYGTDGMWRLQQPNGTVRTIFEVAPGELMFGGSFTMIDGVPAAYLATWGTRDGCCSADFDESEARDEQDVFAFLVAWFARHPSTDYNRNGQLDVPDIFAFLSVWFEGCP